MLRHGRLGNPGFSANHIGDRPGGRFPQGQQEFEDAAANRVAENVKRVHAASI